MRKEAKSILSNPIFHDEKKAREHIERVLWPNGPVCPFCGFNERIYKLEGKTTRLGLYKCGKCRKKFTVTVGTLFERSHIPLNIWLQAVYFMCASKKGFSAHQLHRMLNVTYKTAWFMEHRIREAMKDPILVSKLGGKGQTVEADETYWLDKRTIKERRSQAKKGIPGPRGTDHKEKIFSLVERGGGVRSFHVDRVTGENLVPILQEQVDKETDICTDDMGAYKYVGDSFASHEVVRHSHKEYVRGPIHTNTIENYFSILKRGLVGTFHHVGPQHLKRYLGEFDFRYSNREIGDLSRTEVALEGIVGKRLFYKKRVN